MSLALIMLLTLGVGAAIAAIMDMASSKKDLGYYRPQGKLERREFNNFMRTIRSKSARV